MGQYYRNTILKKNWKQAQRVTEMSLCPYHFDNGAKLMEFSYIGNTLMRSVEYLLANDYNGYPFVTVGDYADEKTTTFYKSGGLDVYSHSSDYEDTEEYKEIIKDIPKREDIPYYPYLVNYTKGVYVKLPKYDDTKWQVHPLSLLCCDGNGRGGGDYFLQDDNYNYELDERIGSWAYDKIGVTDDERYIDGLKEVDGYFKSDW